MKKDQSRIIRSVDQGRWSGIEEKPYKTTDKSLFDGVSRYPIIDNDLNPNIETRYFEIESNGYSSLEFHKHRHTVIVIQGRGSVILDNSYQPIYRHDIIHISALAIHQFIADRNSALGFICIVPSDRDRPQYPTQKEIDKNITDPMVKAKIHP